MILGAGCFSVGIRLWEEGFRVMQQPKGFQNSSGELRQD